MSLLLLFRPRDIPSGRLTPTQKIRRRVVPQGIPNEDDDELLLVLAIQHGRQLTSIGVPT